MSALLPAVALKARLDVVRALRTGEGVVVAIGSWLEVEPDANEQMGRRLVEAVLQAVSDDCAFGLVLLASSAFQSELQEVLDGGR